MSQHLYELLLTLLGVYQVLILLDDVVALRERLASVLSSHMVRKLGEVASVQVDHLLRLGVCSFGLLTHHLAFARADKARCLMSKLILTVFIRAGLLRVESSR